MKNCPFCAEEIQDAAIKCKHCGEMLNTGPTGGAKATGEIPTPAPSPLEAEAVHYYQQALAVLSEVQANIKAYGSNIKPFVGPRCDVDVALQYINRSLDGFPDNPAYLNLKGLLLWEGKGDKEAGVPFLKKAASLAPRDIAIKNNLQRAEIGSPIDALNSPMDGVNNPIGILLILGGLIAFTYCCIAYFASSGSPGLSGLPTAPPAQVTSAAESVSACGQIWPGIKLYQSSGAYIGTVLTDHNGSDTVEVQMASGGIESKARSAVITWQVQTDDPHYNGH